MAFGIRLFLNILVSIAIINASIYHQIYMPGKGTIKLNRVVGVNNRNGERTKKRT